MTAVRPTRVLMVTDTLEVGGAERVAVDIANSLDRRTHEVVFCATRYDGPLRDTLRPDVQVEVLGRRATWDPVGLGRFARLVRRERIDVVHSHGRGTMKFVALSRLAQRPTVPHVFHDHYGRLHLDRRAGRDLRLSMRFGVDEYLGVDSRLCEWARTAVGVPAEHVRLARSGVDLHRFEGIEPIDLRARFDLAGRELVLVMVANFRQQKDHPTVIRALAELPAADRRRIGLVFAGSTTSDPRFFERCMAMIDDLDLTGVVRIAGEQDARPLIAGADGAVLASKNETGPLVVLEYMASGVPVIATDTGEITRSIRGQGVGFTPMPRDPGELADAFAALLAAGPAGRRAMGDRGRELATTVFDQELVTRGIEQVYRGLRSGTPGRGRAEHATRPGSSGRA